MRTETTRRGAALALALTALPAVATAQYANEPFIDQTVVQSQAFGMEMAAIRLMLAQTFEQPLDEELIEQIESLETDFRRFGGTLAARDAALAEELEEAFEAVAEAAEEGEETAELAAAAQELLARAWDTVLDPEVRDAPALKGALILDLLLAEGGVAEGYEEATENVWEYPSGWAAMARVDRLWPDIAPLASEERRADAEEMLDALRALYPDSGPPSEEEVIGWNPEEGEGSAQRLGGILEEVVDADLYPERNMGRLAGHLVGVTETACAAYAAGDEAIGAEGIFAVHDLYARHLGDVVELFAPDAAERAGDLLQALAPLEEEDDDEGEDAGDDDDDDDMSSSEACAELIEALTEARTAVGG